ncbi:MAG TPA: hypothetical protein VF006_33540 [Longimicrobium sp.]
MNKLKLHLDDLRVDSFDTTAAETEKGTVFGEQCTCPTQCTCDTQCETQHTACSCPGCPTVCYYTCEVTCYQESCAETCGDNTCWYQSCVATCIDTCDC